MPVEVKRLRSEAELALAAEQLRHAGYQQCGGCSRWYNETQVADATGSAWDTHCPHCGLNQQHLVED